MDPEDGALGADKVTTQVILHHGDHTHPDQEKPGLTGSFTATFPELVDTYYEIKAAAHDNNGGVAAKSLTIKPKKADITFASVPTGAGITLDGTAHVTPYTQSLIVGSPHTVRADAAFITGGSTYAFQSWANAGTAAATQDLTFNGPTATRTITATYGAPAFPQVYLRGTHTNLAFAASVKMTPLPNNNWSAAAAFGSTMNERFKFDILGDWTQNYGDNAPADGIADLAGADIPITQGAGNYTIAFNGDTKAYTVNKAAPAPQGPVAKAGTDQSVSLTGGAIALDGSASTDADGSISAYHWNQISGPAAAIVSANAAKTTVAIPAATGNQTYAFELTVIDNVGMTARDTALVNQANTASTWKRTVIFVYGQTAVGQDMFIRGGIDHTYANANLGRNCQTTNFECAMPIRHLNLRNATTAPWKTNDNYLDWYGREAAQNVNAVGSPADWTTDIWPDAWGPKKTVAVDGHGEEALNHWGQHYWMLDVEMDCTRSAEGWFEVKSFISNGPGWEPNLSQPGSPYVSGNHFAKCSEINMFKRGTNTWEHSAF